MIIYAYVMGEGVAALFLAGIVPGFLIGLALMGGLFTFPASAGSLQGRIRCTFFFTSELLV